MFERLEDLLRHYEELSLELREGTAFNDNNRYRALMKEEADLKPIAETYRNYKNIIETLAKDTEALREEGDEELRTLLKEEIAELKEAEDTTTKALKLLLIPKDPNDDKNIILEIRSGAGGDEAALFAADLYRMYVRYAESRNWKVETTEYAGLGIGGAGKITAMITGKGAYSVMKFESGVHRVQRVPKTESGGRIHTSTCTVAVLPEADEVEVNINMEDCRFDVFRASGNGGQCVNTTDSAVRLTHIPTGIVISCQDEKSQLKNRAQALKVLRAKLFDLERQKAHDEVAENRKNQVGTGERSEKIRTYNFHQGRVTDHRINVSFHNIQEIMDGKLQELFDGLIAAEQAEKLSKTEM